MLYYINQFTLTSKHCIHPPCVLVRFYLMCVPSTSLVDHGLTGIRTTLPAHLMWLHAHTVYQIAESPL